MRSLLETSCSISLWCRGGSGSQALYNHSNPILSGSSTVVVALMTVGWDKEGDPKAVQALWKSKTLHSLEGEIELGHPANQPTPYRAPGVVKRSARKLAMQVDLGKRKNLHGKGFLLRNPHIKVRRLRAAHTVPKLHKVGAAHFGLRPADPRQSPDMGNLGKIVVGTQNWTFPDPSWSHLNKLRVYLILPFLRTC